jgi:hypothetical protein
MAQHACCHRHPEDFAMLDKTLLALALASGLVAATAHADTWDFTYTGFYSEQEAAFRPDYTLSGRFSGSDKDASGVLERAELTSLVLLGYDHVACEANPEQYHRCWVGGFSFTPGGELGFSAGMSDNEDDARVWDVIIATGDRYYTSFYNYYNGRLDETTLRWTSQTTLEVAPVPVPEPAPAAMILAGLMAVGAAARRRR